MTSPAPGRPRPSHPHPATQKSGSGRCACRPESPRREPGARTPGPRRPRRCPQRHAPRWATREEGWSAAWPWAWHDPSPNCPAAEFSRWSLSGGCGLPGRPASGARVEWAWTRASPCAYSEKAENAPRASHPLRGLGPATPNPAPRALRARPSRSRKPHHATAAAHAGRPALAQSFSTSR